MSHFASAVEAILANWTALQLAIFQNAAGSNSSSVGSWMSGAVAQWFTENKDVEVYEAQEMLESILNAEFNVIVEDGSCDEVGKLLVEFYNLIHVQKASNEVVLSRLSSLPKCDLSRCKVDEDNHLPDTENPDDQDTPMEIEPKKTLNEPDEDGWITVPTRNKK